MDYKIFRLNNIDYSAVIVITKCVPPTSILNLLRRDLNNNNIDGKIIIDALMYFGNNDDRFIEFTYKNDTLIKESFNYIKIDKNNMLRVYASNILKSDNELFDNSILNSFQKKLIAEGCII
ncbi:type II toxin-antitoxin system RnlB family antitoxin [Clostridium polynesiense]|uniref:type II toxin-antitoxin system RnlB family antitoxin n=1 Tax=Clostridium polynesiense TaxID=1325933 RepID=UPI00058B7F60|nr:type II toxin-antitoxin system RnlB family antitoxin [Clostridium polynesiense]